MIKTGAGRMHWSSSCEAGTVSAIGFARCTDHGAFLAGKYSRTSG